MQPKIKEMLHESGWPRISALKVYDSCVRRFEGKYPGAMECLEKDRESMLAFMTSQHRIGSIYGRRIQQSRRLLSASEDDKNQELRQMEDNAGHGLEAEDDSGKEVATTEGIQAAG